MSLVGDYVKTDEARRLIKYGIQDMAVITRPYFLSPGTPKNHVQLLRKAFADTLKDPDLLAEAKKANLDIEPISGEEVDVRVIDRTVGDSMMSRRIVRVKN